MNATPAPRIAPALLLSTVLLAGAAVPAMAQWSQSHTSNNQPYSGQYRTTASNEPAASRSSPHWSLEQVARERLARLHDTLRITQGQQQAWNRFADTSLQNATTLDQLYRQRRDTLQTLNAVQNMQTFTQIQFQQAQDMQRLLPTFQQLYTELSPQQRQTADDMFRDYAERGPARVAQR